MKRVLITAISFILGSLSALAYAADSTAYIAANKNIDTSIPYMLATGYRHADDRSSTSKPDRTITLDTGGRTCSPGFTAQLYTYVVSTDTVTDSRTVQGLVNQWVLQSGLPYKMVGWQWAK